MATNFKDYLQTKMAIERAQRSGFLVSFGKEYIRLRPIEGSKKVTPNFDFESWGEIDCYLNGLEDAELNRIKENSHHDEPRTTLGIPK